MPTRPTILISAYVVDRDDVSEAQMAYEWISRLSRRVDVIVVTTGSRKHATCGLETLGGVQLEIVRPRVSFRRWDGFDRFVHPGYVDFWLQSRRRIRTLMSRRVIHLGHHLTPQALRYPSPMSGLRIPFLAGPYHGSLQPPAVMKELQGREMAFYALRRLDGLRMRCDPLLRSHFRGARRIIVSAPYVMQHLPRYQAKCVLIPGTAMNPAEGSHGLRSERSPARLMFVGKLEPSKGVELLIDALARLTTKDWVLDVYGEGSQGDLYRELAVRNGLAERVNWLGFVSNADVLRAYRTADVFVFPSLKEPTGGALLEAMAAGVPVICVDAGGPAFAVTEACGMKVGLATRETMTAQLAAAIDRMLGSPRLREQLGLGARARFLSHFTWERVVDSMLRLYRQTLEEAWPALAPFDVGERGDASSAAPPARGAARATELSAADEFAS
jgi:glycosyltransferase involved in cell wall biosynthesis